MRARVLSRLGGCWAAALRLRTPGVRVPRTADRGARPGGRGRRGREHARSPTCRSCGPARSRSGCGGTGRCERRARHSSTRAERAGERGKAAVPSDRAPAAGRSSPLHPTVQIPALAVQTSALFAMVWKCLGGAGVCTTVCAPAVARKEGRPLTDHGLERPMSLALSSRAWTVTISSPAGRPALACSACTPPASLVGAAVVSDIRRHLAAHLAESRLPPHLRTCQCRERICAWHRRQGPCSGPLRLLLIRADRGRTWHLADTCTACAAAIPHAAAVPEPPASATSPMVRAPAGEAAAEFAPELVEWVEVP